MVTSTNFSSDNHHIETIRVGEGLIIGLQFTAFDIELYNSIHEYLEIKNGDGFTLIKGGFSRTLQSISDVCQLCLADTTYVSRSNIVRLHFRTPSDTSKSGWSVTWTARKPGKDYFT